MTSMEIGVKLREVFTGIKEKHPSQQALAMAWYEGHGDKKLSAATVESRLSELFNGKLDGVKFFFGQRDRSTVLLRLLGISPSEAEQIYAGAELALAGQLDARTLIDLRAMTDAEVQLACKWIESEVLLHAGLLPMVLLVLPGQAKQIPRGFDDYRDKDHLTWTEDVGKAAERATVLLAPTPWALGPDRQIWPWQKWAQLGFVGGEVLLDPQDGLEQLATSGALVAPIPPEHDLAILGAQADAVGADQWMKSQGATWRSAVERLVLRAEPQSASAVSPAVRLALADRLGLVAGATPVEVEEHEIALVAKEIGAGPIEKWSEGELKARLEKARTRPLAPVVARVNGQLHAINWPACAGRGSVERLVAHEVVAPVPAIDAVRARLVRLAGPDFAVSTDLDELVDELEEAGHLRQAVRHACATLFICGELGAGPGYVYDREVPVDERAESDRGLALAVVAESFADPSVVVETAERGVVCKERLDSLDVVGPGGCVVARNCMKVLVERDAYDRPYEAREWNDYGNVWLEIQQAESHVGSERWLDLYEQWKLSRSKASPVNWKAYDKASVEVNWADLDAFCAMLQVNLRQALEAGRWYELRWREYLVPLGSGICAEVSVEEGERPREGLTIRVLGGLVQPDGRSYAVQPNWRTLPLISGDANCGPRVLEQVTFSAGTTYLHVRFHADPFTASAAQAWPAVVAKVKAVAAEKARQDGYYQDDDD